MAEEAIMDSYPPGTTVLARAKGFPAWPAVVIAEDDVPQDVAAQKPSKKTVVPVLFFNDSSFLWVTPEEAQPLTREAAAKRSEGKIKRTLREAYAMVVNGPEDYAGILASFMPGAEAPQEAEMEVEEEVAPKPSSKRARSASERAAEQIQKTRPAKSRRRESPAPPKKKPVQDAAEEDEESEYVDQSEKTSDSFDEQELQSSHAARLELCNATRATIQEYLLVDKVESTEPVEAAIARIEEAPDMEIAVVRRSKLQRVIFAALMHPLPGNLTERLTSLYGRWVTGAEPVIRGIPEHLAPREESEAPESRDTTPKPEAGDDEVTPEPSLVSDGPVEKTETPAEIPAETPAEKSDTPQLETPSEQIPSEPASAASIPHETPADTAEEVKHETNGEANV